MEDVADQIKKYIKYWEYRCMSGYDVIDPDCWKKLEAWQKKMKEMEPSDELAR